MSVYAKPPVRKGNPNLILVILLVIFVLATIGLGLWGYYGYQGQEDLKKAAKDKGIEATVALKSKEYYTYLALELRLINNDNLTDDERGLWRELRKEFFKENGKFDKEKTRTQYLDLITNRQAMFGWDEDNEKYQLLETKKEEDAGKKQSPTKFLEETRKLQDDYAKGLEALRQKYKEFEDGKKDDNSIWKIEADLQRKRLTAMKADLIARDKRLETFDKILQKDNEQHEQNYRKLLKEIQDESKKSLSAAMKQSDAMVESFARNSELINTMTQEKEAHEEAHRGWFKEKERLKEEIDKLEARNREALPAGDKGIAPVANALARPLFLDVSMGKPLWDRPVGTVIAVNGDKVLIHVNTDDRLEDLLKTKLTFNVFGTKDRRAADGTIKATIEVISLEGGKAAICRVTNKFAKSDPIFEGDLLYNLTWGTHVAVAGQVNLFSKSRGVSQVEQDRNLKHFLAKLESQGVIVDAYVDLIDGSVKGKYKGIVPTKTQFLILGDGFVVRPGIGDENQAKTLKEINDKISELHTQAVKMGLFTISPENFANVAGYRKIGGYGPEDVPFEPTLPAVNVKQ